MKDSVCFRCKKKLDYKPNRLNLQKYQLKPYKQYTGVANIDLCNNCYDEFEIFVKHVIKATKKPRTKRLNLN